MDCINEKRNSAERKENDLLRIVFGDGTFGVHHNFADNELHCIFSYAAGGMESLVTRGREWLYRIPRPAFWRATTDNDKGNKFPLKSGMWLSADLFIRCVGIQIQLDGREITDVWGPENNVHQGDLHAAEAVITYLYETITCPSTRVSVTYSVKNTGVIDVNTHFFGKKDLPELPVFGLRFIMPTCAERFCYEGLSGETYPDRKAGGIHGIYEVKGLPVTPYLTPQDCGMHMDTDWVEIYRSSSLDNRKTEQGETMLRFELNKMAFSCLPYTACELENATHQEELPVPRRTVLCIYRAVRGIGGIDSWGSDVEEQYHISAEEDMDLSFRICL